MRFETLRYGWDEENPLNGRAGASGLRASPAIPQQG
jgi:hypothetical protein